MASGVLLSVHVVPVLEGRIVAFVLDSPGPQGRWLPWTVLTQGANPYEIASTIVDEWCDGAMSDLRLVDVISREGEDGWELAIVFRAELTACRATSAAPLASATRRTSPPSRASTRSTWSAGWGTPLQQRKGTRRSSSSSD